MVTQHRIAEDRFSSSCSSIESNHFLLHNGKSRQLRLVLILSGVLLSLFTGLIIFLLVSHNFYCYGNKMGRICNGLYTNKKTVLLISMDGFRHDYIELTKQRFGPKALPNFDRLIRGGVRAMESINTYPTITLPNHRALVTGLYPEYHGVVGNNLIDKKFPSIKFSMGDQDSLNSAPWLTNWAEPIWVTLQKAGGLAGSLLWPLTDQPVLRDLPFQQVSQFTLLNQYSFQYDFAKRVRDILWWLQNPHYHLDLILAYFSEPDEVGHAYGPNSKEVAVKVQYLDTLLGELLNGIVTRGLNDSVDIIVTADHGMTELSSSRLIGLNDYVNNSLFTYTQLSTMGFIYPSSGHFEEVYLSLKNAHPRMQVYRREEVPEFLHFNVSHSRMPPLVIVVDPGWTIVLNATAYFPNGTGNHGYSTNFSESHAFFIASGPSFRIGESVDTVQAVDVYPLMCSLLGIQPQPNNGSLKRISGILKPHVADRLLTKRYWRVWWLNWLLSQQYVFIIVLLVFALLVMLCLIPFYMRRRRRRDDPIARLFDWH